MQPLPVRTPESCAAALLHALHGMSPLTQQHCDSRPPAVQGTAQEAVQGVTSNRASSSQPVGFQPAAVAHQQSGVLLQAITKEAGYSVGRNRSSTSQLAAWAVTALARRSQQDCNTIAAAGGAAPPSCA